MPKVKVPNTVIVRLPGPGDGGFSCDGWSYGVGIVGRIIADNDLDPCVPNRVYKVILFADDGRMDYHKKPNNVVHVRESEIVAVVS